MNTRFEQILRLGKALACAFCALAIGLVLLPTTALAQDASLTLQMQHESKGQVTTIDGVTATVYLVASLNDGINSYTLTDDFASLGIDFNKGLDASGMEAAALKAQSIAKNGKLTGKQAMSGKDGKASFGVLPKGVYLVVQSKATGTASKYNDFKPFLISVPQLTANEIVYDVVAYPKTTLAPVSEPPKKPLAKTGDDANPRLWMTCAIAGAVLLTLGMTGRRRMKQVASQSESSR